LNAIHNFCLILSSAKAKLRRVSKDARC